MKATVVTPYENSAELFHKVFFFLLKNGDCKEFPVKGISHCISGSHGLVAQAKQSLGTSSKVIIASDNQEEAAQCKRDLEGTDGVEVHYLAP